MLTTAATYPVRVVDPDDARLAPYRNLKDVGVRTTGCFIAESELVVRRMIDAGQDIQSLLLTDARHGRLEGAIRSAPHLPVFVTSPEILDRVVGFPLHRGVLGLVRRPTLPSFDSLLPGGDRVVVVLEDVVDPDNIGAVFRHSAGFGADAVLLTEHAGDPLYRKTVRASMGWALGVPYARLGSGDDLIDVLAGHDYVSVALTPDRSARPVSEVLSAIAPGVSIALLLGAENPGLAERTLRRATFRARIPMAAHVDSLNIASAAAIALYEIRRARPLP